MRPVNLIPADQRHGQHSPMRTGQLPYLVLGVLVLLLIAVALLVTASNQVSESKSELARLEREDKATEEQAARLAAYTQFQAVHEQRLMTITSLADSRFDWERVMRELALVLPSDVWLSELNASASSSAEGGASSSGGLRGAVAGPALEINGCATGQEAVAGFISDLKDIDGVTRVGVEESALPDQENGSVSSGGEEGSGGCQTRDFIAEFKITVAFDAAPVPAIAGAEGEEVAAEGEAPEEAAPEAEGSSEGETEATAE
ncbi:MAG: PilN domain-containing protein [Solirubrobacterales bacterium]